MARKTSRGDRDINRSEAIRQFLETNPTATPKVVIAALKEDPGIEVTNGLVSFVKNRFHKKRKLAAGGNGSLSVEDLREVKKLADRLGGLHKTKQAIAVLEQLQ